MHMASVLIVDDSRFARRALRSVVEQLGYVADEAASGAETLRKYAEKHYDVVTLDLVMPDMDGLEVLSKLREIDPNVRVIVATADIQDATRAQVLGAGGRALVNKPIKEQDLQRALADLLEEPAAWP
jgi:CheY-like chemotaxis protein